MHWVILTGATVDDARARALDVLGIDDSDLDLEVLGEPTSRLFGLRTTPARVRARVRPTRPRPKAMRRPRRNKSRDRRGSNKRRRDRPKSNRRDDAPKQRSDGPGRRDDPDASDRVSSDARSSGGRRRQRGPRFAARTRAQETTDATGTTAGTSAEPGRGPREVRPAGDTPPPKPVPTPDPGPDNDDSNQQARLGETKGTPMSDIPLTEQEPTAVSFLTGLVEAFDVDADVASTVLEDDEAVEIEVTGDDLGLLVGPRGATLSAVSELTRTAVAQAHSGRLEGRLRVDIAGYRARRKEALERFATQMADKARETESAVALEPMSPPDRKIVHDAVNEIDGVHTESRGEDRRRHVVILPD